MQSTTPRAPSALGRLCSRIAGLPLGGFAAPPPAMIDTLSAAAAPPEPRASHTRIRSAVDARSPIRWTNLSAVR